MQDTRWWTFVQRISDHATPAQIGRDARLDKSSPSRWSKGGGVEASQAVAVARAYGANVLEALAAAGFINDDEVHLTEVDRGLHDASTVDMLRELLRRANVGDGLDTEHIDEFALAADTADQSPDEDLRTP